MKHTVGVQVPKRLYERIESLRRRYASVVPAIGTADGIYSRTAILRRAIQLGITAMENHIKEGEDADSMQLVSEVED